MLAYLLASARLGGAEGAGVDGEDLVSGVTIISVGIVGAAVVVVVGVVHVDDSILVKIEVGTARVWVALVRVVCIEDAVAVVVRVILIGETIGVEIAGGAASIGHTGVVVIRVIVWAVWACIGKIAIPIQIPA